MEAQRPMIAVVDDDLPIVELLDEVLTDEDYTVRCITESEQIVYDVKRLAPQLLILDIHFSAQHTGWDVLTELRDDHTTAVLPVIVCTADTRGAADLPAAPQTTLTWLVTKPFALDTLLVTIDKALEAGPPRSVHI